MSKKCFLILIAILLINTVSLYAQDSVYHPIFRYGRGAPQSIAWHPSGEMILVNSVTGAWLYDPDTLEDLRHLEGIQSAQFSPDGNWLIGLATSGRAQLWNMTTFEFSILPSDILERSMSFTWRPDSTQVAGLGSSRQLMIWSVPDASIESAVLTDYGGEVFWSPDGKKLLTSHIDNSIRLWGTNNFHQLIYIPPEAFYPSKIAPDPNRPIYENNIRWKPNSRQFIRIYYSHSDTILQAYDADTGVLVAETNQGINLEDADFNSDGTRLAGSVGLYDVNTYELINRLDVESPYSVDRLDWDPDGRKIAYAGYTYKNYFGDFQGNIKVVDVTAPDVVENFEVNIGGIRDLRWSPDGRRMAISDYKGQLIIWDYTTKIEMARNENHVRMDKMLAFSSDGKLLAAADEIENIRIWDTETGELLFTLKGNLSTVNRLAWQPGGRLLATKTGNLIGPSGSLTFLEGNYVVRIWDGTSGELVAQLPYDDWLTDLTWKPDGGLLYISLRSSVQVWDTLHRRIIPEAEIQRVAQFPIPTWNSDTSILKLYFLAGSEGAHKFNLYNTDNHKLIYESNFSTDPIWNSGGTQLRVISQSCEKIFPDGDCTFGIRILFDKQNPTPNHNREDAERGALLPIGFFTISPPMMWSPNGDRIAIIYENALQIWDIGKDAARQILSLDDVQQVIWAPDSTRLLLVNTNASITIINVNTGENRVLWDGNNFRPGIASWSPDGSMLIGYDKNQALSVFDATNGESLAMLQGSSLTWSPNSSMFAEQYDGTVALWAR